MPTFNGTGQFIEDSRDLVYISKTKSLSHYWWPKDVEYLWHLPWSDFKVWIYLLEPREAMLLSNDKEFIDFREAKRRKGVVGRFFSWCWMMRRKLWV